MLSGLLMGFAVVAFAACTLFVLNGRAERWLQMLFQTQKATEGSK